MAMSVVVGPKPETGSGGGLCEGGGRLDARTLDPHHGDVCRLGFILLRVRVKIRVSVRSYGLGVAWVGVRVGVGVDGKG